jgi:hypothetical protein
MATRMALELGDAVWQSSTNALAKESRDRAVRVGGIPMFYKDAAWFGGAQQIDESANDAGPPGPGAVRAETACLLPWSVRMGGGTSQIGGTRPALQQSAVVFHESASPSTRRGFEVTLCHDALVSLDLSMRIRSDETTIPRRRAGGLRTVVSTSERPN